ncbi:long-chain-acyl-CoA synthetase [Antrihabitans cavernicola]|uniref:Long-chain-acyl-CoA synthetase n=1 Tax=Antrihabitans cavernicola TaxID=2495913 RepID=A0A5A7S8V3_9NOCA|nr:long-chain-acyl-CoA synthetase [Spelaeibacter cavernicola]KAA0022588.1 long-chain-acyl-CoA synthetase [Spelaeibacter cavernicola]
MSSSGRPTIGVVDVVRRLPAMLPDLPGMAMGAANLLLRKPDSKGSVGLVFQRAAQRHPERPFLRFEGNSVGYGEANEQVNRYAVVLSAHGVVRGDVVGVLMKNRPETLFLVLAIAKLGATAGLLNHNQRSDVLAHSLGLLDSRVLVVGDECQEAIDSLDAAPQAETVLTADDVDREAVGADDADPPICEEITGREKAYLIFTSGTTGMPKASVMTHYRWLKGMAGLGSLGVRLSSDDTLYCCLPLYHNNALTVALSSVLGSGATFALGKSFSASRFWDDANLNKATGFAYIGELCRYLLNQPARSTDRDNNIRLMVGNGLRPEIWDEFKTRFGISRVAEFYGASEGNIAFVNALNLDRTAGVCPLPYAVVEYDDESGKAKRDSNGLLRKVGKGEVGLLLAKVTDRAPFDGYTDKSASESKLVRDGFDKGDVWFDTGDLVRKQGWMHIAFVDRLGDTFRWKGENVATTEVEGALGDERGVDQAVVYGVDVPGTDGKAGMAAVMMKDGAGFDGKAVAGHLYDRLPAYAVPLFIRIVDSLEQTSTFKSRKVELRKLGYSNDAEGTLYVLAGKSAGYVDAYETYADDVAGGSVPKG